MSGKPYSWVDDFTPSHRSTRRYTHHEPVLYPRFPETEVPVPAEATPCIEEPDEWFPEGNTKAAKLSRDHAGRLCAGCWMRPECLDYGLAHPEVEGIWGGWTQSRRQAYKTVTRRGR